MRAISLIILAVGVVSACASNPSIPVGKSINEFVNGINEKQYNFNLGSQTISDTLNGLADEKFGYVGLKIALWPAFIHCQSSNGKAVVVESVRAGPRLAPSLLRCLKGQDFLWEVDLTYDHIRTESPWLFLTVHSELITPEILEARRQKAIDKQRAEAEEWRRTEPKRRAESEERKRMAEIQQMAIEKEQAQIKEAARLFRTNLKPKDRFQWKIPGDHQYAVGMVIRIEGDLIFVQFDNLTMGGQNTRYIDRAQVEPWNGRMPAVRLDLR